MNSSSIQLALEAAITAGNSVRGTTSPNPPVGAAILDLHGDIVGIGSTQPPHAADNAHAEIMALRSAGARARGGIAVVTLEPCNHQGRTGPCAVALAEAGIAEVYYATADPNPTAAGGAEYLRSRGIPTTHLDVQVDALQPWLISVRHGRACVTAKMAQTLDGFSAAEDGSSQWITGAEARAHATAARAQRDAIIVGTGTALADSPQLTARAADGSLLPHQPQRVVVGRRSLPAGHPLSSPDVWRFATLDEALDALHQRGMVDVLLEGGPTLIGSALAAGAVDIIHSYLNPSFLGSGLPAAVFAPDSDRPTSIGDLSRYTLHRVMQLGGDVLLISTRQ
ncbi:bifunctional diaminohydroxyphosphoribosylaminopyrimidine deaminase/5-amino-6-(5-phosphoribosylamino)uracil reductase RibD [Staphylococcus chromogenes]|nr:bifunctional diaminohydroxyphosphoribosylaminopyrimidine deaminase/5-amino-6-(5-phosphoribosylamino)uracil reductase RibD [Staphylococcus chromogenes]